MPPATPLLLLLAPLAAVGASLGLLALLASILRGAPVDVAALAQAVLLAPLWGRAILGFLPPGDPGGCRPADALPLWAASATLGGLWLTAISALPEGWTPWLVPLPPIAALALVSLGALPLRPRHPLPSSPSGPWMAPLLLGPGLFAAAPGPVFASAFLALAAARTLAPRGPALAHGLAGAVAGLVGLAAETREPSGAPAVALWAAATLGLVGFVRRADRRGLWLASLCFGGTAWAGVGPIPAGVGFALLALATPAGARASLAPAMLAGGALGLGAWL